MEAATLRYGSTGTSRRPSLITMYTSRSGNGDWAAGIVTHSRKSESVTGLSFRLSSVALGNDKSRKASPVCMFAGMVAVWVVVALLRRSRTQDRSLGREDAWSSVRCPANVTRSPAVEADNVSAAPARSSLRRSGRFQTKVSGQFPRTHISRSQKTRLRIIARLCVATSAAQLCGTSRPTSRYGDCE